MDWAAILSASFRASSISASAGTTRATRPDARASAASIIRPLRHISMRLGLAHRPHQPLAAAQAGDNAQGDLGLAEFGAVGRQDHESSASASSQPPPRRSRRRRR